MPAFDENCFIWALTSRPEDAKRLATSFKPEWLDTPELVPVVREIFSFTKEHGTPPSLPTLKKIFNDKDPQVYKTRLEPVLNEVESINPDMSELIYTMGQVKDVSITRSLEDLCRSQDFLKSQSEYNGKFIMRKMVQWMHQFQNVSDEETLNLKEAVEKLVLEQGFETVQNRIPTGISILDEWYNGGLRTKNLGIVMAPSGHGKSALLMNMAYKAASLQIPVWFITNELTMAEQTERFLSRMTGVELNRIEDDPVLGYNNLDHYWSKSFHENLWITSISKEVSTNDLESILQRQINLYGWSPKLIILDFMERMRPNDSGYSRDKEWNWLGGIAKDLIQLAKRRNLLIWSATQTNRSGMKADILDETMMQGSTRHLQEAAAFVAMRQVFLMSENTESPDIAFEFFNFKARSAKKRMKSRCLKVNLSSMYISSEEVELPKIERNKDQEHGEDLPTVEETTEEAPKKKMRRNFRGK